MDCEDRERLKNEVRIFGEKAVLEGLIDRLATCTERFLTDKNNPDLEQALKDRIQYTNDAVDVIEHRYAVRVTY